MRSCGPIAGRPKLTKDTAACAAVAAVSTVRGERACTSRDYGVSWTGTPSRATSAAGRSRRHAPKKQSREQALTERTGRGRDRARRMRGSMQSVRRLEPEDVALVREVLDAPVFVDEEDDTVEPAADEGRRQTGSRGEAESEIAGSRARSRSAAAAARVPALRRRPRILTGPLRRRRPPAATGADTPAAA